MKQLTVIVPAYNVSQYIEECLNSLIGDELILKELDIIVINDGSKDDTLNKIIPYVQKYPDTINLIDKENGGHGSGINVGVSLAKGKYLKVLDSDDWVDNSSLKRLVNYIISLEDAPDIIINSYEQVWEDENKTIVHDLRKLAVKKSYRLTGLNDNGYRFTIHSLTIKTSIYQRLVKTHIDEKTSYDDVEYVLYPVPYIHTLVYLDDILYKYRMRSVGQSVSFKNMQKNRDKLRKILINTWNYFQNNQSVMNRDQEVYFLRDLGYTIGDYLNLLFTLDDRRQAKVEFKSFLNIVKIPVEYIVSNKARFTIRTKGIFFNQVSCWYRKRLEVD